MKILVVDDDPQLRRVMRTSLTAHDYEVVDARTGEEAIERLGKEHPTLVVIDLNMPGMGGFETCRRIRACSEVPIIVLSVRASADDKIAALDLGADDYVTKPFLPEELLARIRAVTRRIQLARGSEPHVLAVEGVKIDFEAREVTKKGSKEHLTPKEFDLLRYLMSHAGQVIPHRRILQAVWGPDYGNEVDYLRVFITQLRKKIEPDLSRPRFILTEPHVGYRFVLPEKTPKKP